MAPLQEICAARPALPGESHEDAKPERPAAAVAASDPERSVPEAGEPPREENGRSVSASEKKAAKDRLAAALRENLRRRKAQRAGRGAAALRPAARRP